MPAKKKLIETYIVKDLAEALKLHPYTLHRLCREGKIPVFPPYFIADPSLAENLAGSGGLMLER